MTEDKDFKIHCACGRYITVVVTPGGFCGGDAGGGTGTRHDPLYIVTSEAPGTGDVVHALYGSGTSIKPE